MEKPIVSERVIDHATMWRYMRRLLDRIFGALESEKVLDDCLDAILELLGADRGFLLFAYSDGTFQAVHGRSGRGSVPTISREEIARTLVHDALETGQCVVFDAAAEMSPSASAVSLGLTAALAAPVHTHAGTKERRGALYVDFLQRRRPLDEMHIEFFMAAALLLGAVLEQNRRSELVVDHLREARSHTVLARETPSLDDLLSAPSMHAVRAEVFSALKTSEPILVLGESGTGKTLLAHAIADASGRKPFVRATLGCSDDLNTMTSELFGHESGAFTGSAGKRIGLVEYARGGTLVFDELLNLPLQAQKLLLDFTQFGTYRPLGYNCPEPKRAEVRIISATNGDLRGAIRAGGFREDLYHRLAAVTIHLPALRERREDIPVLAEAALRRVSGRRRWTLTVSLRRLLTSPELTWSGNVRQLERVMLRARERALARDSEASELCPEHFEARDFEVSSLGALGSSAPTASEEVATAVRWQRLQQERERIDEQEAHVVREALSRAGGVVAQAARELGVARTTLSSRLDALGIRSPRRASEPPPR